MRLQPALSSSPIRWGSTLLLSTLLLCSPLGVGAKKDEPTIVSTKFDHAPVNVQYFDDSDVIMFQDWDSNSVLRSADAGATWKSIDGGPTGPKDGQEWNMYMHPRDNKRAYVLSEGTTHWKTSDRGETWEKFVTDAPASAWRPSFTWHGSDPDRIIFNAQNCPGLECEELSIYTTDGFKSSEVLRLGTSGCQWAKTTPEFTTGDDDLDKNRILCISRGKYSYFSKDFRLVISDNYFKSKDDVVQEYSPELANGRVVTGIVEMAPVKGYIVAAAKSAGTDEMALYVSDDTKKWHQAIFPKDHRLNEQAYTILESTNYSIQIDVLTTRTYHPMGVLFSSNSNGTYFTRLEEHTNRDSEGFVDFEKMSGVQGIVLVNVVDNWKEVETKSLTKKKVQSKISFDDGRTWQALKIKDESKDELHLHSVTNLRNIGKVFSSPAPGLVMGVGNTGDHLGHYADDGNTYVSDDAGVTWIQALKGPHKYEFGDSGSILVAVPEGKTNKLKYSLNHGKDWKEYKMDEEIYPLVLTTTMDSSSLKFLMIATTDKKHVKDFRVISVDFDNLHEGQCKDGDMEKWYARVDDKGEPTCLMGHKQYYLRRKADADCFVKHEFKDPEPQYESCECTDADFECDFNFVRSEDRKECVKQGPFIIPEGACKSFDASTTFKGSSGWRLIPGNDCKRTNGAQKDDPVDRKCDEVFGPPADGKVKHVTSNFKTSQNMFTEKVYLERTETSNGDDETVLALIKNTVHISKDSGKKWEKLEALKSEIINVIIPHPYFNDIVYFLGDKETVYYSMHRGENIRKFKVPNLPDPKFQPVMSFHEKNKEWIIFTGVKDCGQGGDCHGVSSITRDRGDNWQTLERYVGKCEFIKENPPQQRDPKLIYCTKHKEENVKKQFQLISSPNFFEDDEQTQTHFDSVVGFATMAEFIVVAAKDKNGNLRADASVDGRVFAEALFPSNFKVDHQSAYTVLDSSTHSVFLHVTVETADGAEHGSIIKSNSNGTSYVLSISGVNRNGAGYVDFEKMYGLEGVAMVNVVANKDTVVKDGKKILQSVITHNDGAEWRFIKPPAKNFDGKSFDCSGNECGLHLHSYTERTNPEKRFASESAVGLMFATGNVGKSLSKMSEADTFMTTDAGINWKVVKQGPHMWSYGDQGAVIVIAPEGKKTKSVFYTTDEGDNWIEYTFSDTEVAVHDLTTVPSTNSRNFIVWCQTDDGLQTVNIDFTGLTDKMCVFDETKPENDYYYLWSPKHPTQENDCLFGHVSQYHRKKTSAVCYNPYIPEKLHNIAQNCTCTRRDFECDYNYEGKTDGSCVLVSGLPPPNHAESCANNPDQMEYFEPSGYRRIPLTTCQGGRELEYIGQPKPCPGKEGDFEKKHGIGAVGLFFAITIPIAAAAGVGYWVWRNWAYAGFGQIRLGEQSTFDDQAPYVKYPVMAVSALVAVLLTLPTLLGAGWNELSKLWKNRRGMNRYTTRSSFGRESNYAVVDEDEGELLGDDSDEEV